ncbi:MAG: lipopolysaccharide heptosyltransferase II [Gammaproteobacteria bacterium]|nr:lipopolysaccharide heptosyltransferase II [Gammaproteobacteria bacterium]
MVSGRWWEIVPTSIQQKILIIGPAWVGDMVMAQSLFKLIKQTNPTAIIDVLAPAWTFSLLTRMPEVREAIELPLIHGELGLRKRYQVAKTLRKEAYDQAIILPNSFKSALIPWFAQIPLRTGWLGEYRYFVLNDRRQLDKQRYPLMVDQFMALGLPKNAVFPQQIFHPALTVSAGSQEAVLAKCELSQTKRPILAICPGAEFGPSKRWPEAHYAAIANQKIKQGWEVWLLGSQKDALITEKIMALTEERCQNIAGRLNLAETIDLLSLVSGVITNDSGLMHIAAALKKPLIALYGSTSPAFTPPLSDAATVLKLNLACQPCFQRRCPLEHHRCLRDLLPERVATAMEKWEIE